jgi:ABC-type polysaccharide/polyol phosphate export permease
MAQSSLGSSGTIAGTSLAVAVTNFKQKHEDSLLGILWYLLEPLFVFAVLLLIRKALDIQTPFYPLYLFLGLIMFNFFAHTTGAAARSLLSNGGLIAWINIRLEIFPLAVVIQHLFSHLFEVLILIGVVLWVGAPIQSILFYPIALLPLIFFTLGISMALSILTVIMRDIGNVWRVVIGRVVWLATPIFYTVSEGTQLYALNQWNPLYHFMEFGRSLLVYGRIPELHSFLITYLVGILSLLGGWLIFRSLKHRAPELL